MPRTTPKTPPRRDLTVRQLEIVAHLANGYRMDEIAVDLHLSVSSVEKTIKAARKRVAARTQAHLVSIVIASGVLEWDTRKQMRRLGDSNGRV